MEIAVFGLGYVGVTAAACMAESGHSVLGIDISEKKTRAIAAGRSPIVEPEIDAMLGRALAAGRIRASTEIGDGLESADLAVVCVGTPSGPDGAHNMGFIAEVTRQIAASVAASARETPLTVAYRSTIRPGTVEELILPIFRARLGDRAHLVEVAYNPEFLREGSAVKDYFAPPKIVIGTADGGPNPAMEALNEGIEAPVFRTKYRAAEVTKFVDNTWHAVKVAFANEIGRVCLDLGIEARTVHEIFVSDTKLNISPYYMRPGGAFGGSCLPKDVRALQHIGSEIGANLPLVDSLMRSNAAHKARLADHAMAGLAPGARVLLAGLAFKAGTDDLRESPNVDLARRLLAEGFALEIFDPAVEAEALVGANLGYAYARLPQLEELLVDRATAEARLAGGAYARVVATNATVKALALPPGTDLCDIATLP